jgi:integrase
MRKHWPHGTGHVYKQTYRTADGTIRETKVWWLAFWHRGRLVRESARTESKAQAEKLLRQRMAAKDAGLYAGPDARRTTLTDLRRILEDNYRANGRPVQGAHQRFAHLEEHFGAVRPAREITTDRLVAYQAARLEQGARPATVNRELAALRRAFRLAEKAGRVETRPVFELLREDNTRTGFFERDAFEAVRAKLPEWLQPVVTFQYLTGWRTGETLRLQWAQVDLKAGVIRLEPGTTKNRDGRVLPYRALPELAAVIEAQRAETRRQEHEQGRVIPWVFHRDGRPLRAKYGASSPVYEAWRAACAAVGVPGRILHDFRRTAVRILERAGVSRSVAMKITGHKTEAVYRRYAIVSEADIADGLAKVAALRSR